MSENNSNFKIEQGSEKSFGLLFSIVFLIVALYPLISLESVRVWALLFSAICFLLAFIAPHLLVLPNRFWFKLGVLLGSIIAPIVMAFIYCITIIPTGVIMRLLGKELLNPKFDKNAKSYWINREEPMGSMKNQF